MLNIKEIALKVANEYDKREIYFPYRDDLANFAEALIESYKAELLNEAGEPVAECLQEYGCACRWWWTDEGTKLPVGTKLFTSGQVASAILKATKPLEDQLAKAEQRVVEAIVDMLQQKHRNCFGAHSFYLAASVATANGAWKEFKK